MSRHHRAAPTVCALLVALSTAGCIDLAPTYARPPLPVADQWPRDSTAPLGESAAPEQMAWRALLPDERLRAVISLALRSNRDLRVATLNVSRARALYRVQAAAGVPQLALGAGVSRSGSDAGAASTVNLTASVPAYELDLFGRVRNLSAEALQTYLSSVEAQRSAHLALVSEVAAAWIALDADQSLLRLSQDTVALAEKSLALTRRMHELGAIKGLPVAQAEAALASYRGTVLADEQQVAQDRNALMLVVGAEVPDDLLPTTASPAKLPSMPVVPPGIPSQVLVQRPDVLASEHALQAAQLDIGVARAALFPSIGLTGSAGLASASLSSLFKPGTSVWTYGASISLPLFDAGAARANISATEASRDIAVATYDKTIQSAFREIADALSVRALLADQIAQQRLQTGASQRASQDALALFRVGASSYLEVLDAQRSLLSSQRQEIALQHLAQDNSVTLYRALAVEWKDVE